MDNSEGGEKLKGGVEGPPVIPERFWVGHAGRRGMAGSCIDGSSGYQKVACLWTAVP